MAALAVGALELLAPGYIFLGFAIGAMAAALVSWAGILTGFPAQLALAAGVSLLAWAGLHRVFPRARGSVKRFNGDIND
ncbi:MAG: hypothetical protein U5N10_04505 [Gemmobacter sp.]|nr:hypothetical protein [Gemmobacter sp.]